jgi:Uncharacterized membrane protein (homolog of Drosophila rhomboid)
MSQPAINLPPLILQLLGVIWGIFLLHEFGLLPWQAYGFLVFRADLFIKALSGSAPLSVYFSILGYSLMHGGFMHVIFNSLWLAAIGKATLARLNSLQFLMVLIVGSIGGAVAHMLAHPGEATSMVGLSASISALFGIFCRIPGHRGQALPLLSDRVTRFSLGFLAINLLLGLLPGVNGAGMIAWQAHLGGFFAGLLTAPFFLRAPILKR